MFNKNYRYNYKFDNSQLISNVLFADSVKQTGTDTTYIMNDVGVISGSTLNIVPQFLMKKVIKLANGDVLLQDTTNIKIIPQCIPNQTWIFDSNYNLYATCVSISTLSIFNNLDSVKLILINSVDTMILSKQFGIIQFPKLYGANKYYRLVGIEKAKRYEMFAFYGQKVPNAWDFYNYNTGYNWCEQHTYKDINQSCGNTFNCYKRTMTVIGKTVTPTGYDYDLAVSQIASGLSYTWCSFNSSFVVNYTTNISLYWLDSTYLTENVMYPGMLTPISAGWWPTLVRFGIGTNNNFSKVFGDISSSMYSYLTPQVSSIAPVYNYVSPTTYTGSTNGYDHSAAIFSSGQGRTFGIHGYWNHEEIYSNGCNVYVSLSENTEEQKVRVFPNPASSKLVLPIECGVIKFYDSFGKLINELNVEEENTIDISYFPNGLYFLEIQSDSFRSSQKLIIQH